MGLPVDAPRAPAASQQAQVEAWRLKSILAVLDERGERDLPSAELLAVSRSDLHEIIETLEAGCPTKIAVDIFT